MAPTPLTDIQRGLLRCPVCRSAITRADAHSLYCKRRHCFDLARAGYVNLLQKPVQSAYDKGLFDARYAVLASGFFGTLVAALGDALACHCPTQTPRILDAGCGEGSILAALGQRLSAQSVLAGVDLAKDAVRLAAAHYAGPLWGVADLTALPFADGVFDALLCVLSPSNYNESRRVLRTGGLLLKVSPGPDYLRELRHGLYAGQAKDSYSNERVVEHFDRSFGLVETRTIRYAAPVGDLLPQLLRMTPLAWRADDEAHNRLLEAGLSHVTIDLSLMIGRKAKKEGVTYA